MARKPTSKAQLYFEHFPLRADLSRIAAALGDHETIRHRSDFRVIAGDAPWERTTQLFFDLTTYDQAGEAVNRCWVYNLTDEERRLANWAMAAGRMRQIAGQAIDELIACIFRDYPPNRETDLTAFLHGLRETPSISTALILADWLEERPGHGPAWAARVRELCTQERAPKEVAASVHFLLTTPCTKRDRNGNDCPKCRGVGWFEVDLSKPPTASRSMNLTTSSRAALSPT